ncbi:MAG: hypothetical protein C6P37_14805 [Caldibacillus debilis]|nr:MAG: hypothetical protein C6W57_14450 [Caldibacillus debilis]REJ25500.1 MAG: hypothetical protein C6P37_14805 [Caldibacillus debilis]REJ30333.1 MAG: hypothetical protein C6W56_03705 [Caldibacillus debilis]
MVPVCGISSAYPGNFSQIFGQAFFIPSFLLFADRSPVSFHGLSWLPGMFRLQPDRINIGMRVDEMKRYEMYLIDEQVADFFYGRERKFYNLFKEYEGSAPPKKEILEKQIDFITKPIPVLTIHSQIIRLLEGRQDFYIRQGKLVIENHRGKACLQIDQRAILLESNGYGEGENTFLDLLKKTEYNFLAIDRENGRYGWLKPLKRGLRL